MYPGYATISVSELTSPNKKAPPVLNGFGVGRNGHESVTLTPDS